MENIKQTLSTNKHYRHQQHLLKISQNVSGAVVTGYKLIWSQELACCWIYDHTSLKLKLAQKLPQIRHQILRV